FGDVLRSVTYCSALRQPVLPVQPRSLQRTRTRIPIGTAHAPFRPMGSTREDMVLDGVTLDRLQVVAALLRSVDHLRP
ncbi:MAG UNVERIFIED_CONTAM: hypothetical protein LVR18_35315, partial [Planctomycetaceae bacterium]